MFQYPTTKEYLPSKSGEKVLRLIFGYFKRTGKPWAYLDQQWMLDKIEDWHGVKMARSTLNYNLRKLEDAGYLVRTSRHIKDANGKFFPRVTMYKITKKLRTLFYRVAEFFKRIGWTPSLKQLKAGWVPVVGKVTTKEDAHREYVLMRRRGAN